MSILHCNAFAILAKLKMVNLRKSHFESGPSERPQSSTESAIKFSGRIISVVSWEVFLSKMFGVVSVVRHDCKQSLFPPIIRARYGFWLHVGMFLGKKRHQKFQTAAAESGNGICWWRLLWLIRVLLYVQVRSLNHLTISSIGGVIPRSFCCVSKSLLFLAVGKSFVFVELSKNYQCARDK